MNKNRKPRIETERYTFAHNHGPRGFGSWAFHPDFNVDASSPEILWVNQATYTEAKKKAQIHFAGHYSVSVLS